MDGSTPYSSAYGAPPPENQRPPAPNELFRREGPDANNTPSRKRVGLLAGGVVIAVILGIAALITSIFAAAGGTEPSPTSTNPEAQGQELFVDEADKPLCEDIAPLMKESDEKNHALTDAGPPGSPERSAVIPEFKKHTLDWATRMQKLINKHADPPRYLTRTLQAYVDNSLLYSENIYPDRAPDSYDSAVWDSAAVAYGGPLGTCYKLGVKW